MQANLLLGGVLGLQELRSNEAIRGISWGHDNWSKSCQKSENNPRQILESVLY